MGSCLVHAWLSQELSILFYFISQSRKAIECRLCNQMQSLTLRLLRSACCPERAELTIISEPFSAAGICRERHDFIGAILCPFFGSRKAAEHLGGTVLLLGVCPALVMGFDQHGSSVMLDPGKGRSTAVKLKLHCFV